MNARELIAFTTLAVSGTALLAACSTTTTQTSPIYQQSTKYKVHSPYTSSTSQTGSTTQAASYAQDPYAGQASTTYASSYNSYNRGVSNTTSGQVIPSTHLDQACLDRETNRELVGAGIGGVTGAVVGHEVIGGTAGTVAGAAVGGAIGWGIGDKSINCDPVVSNAVSSPMAPTQAYNPAMSQGAGQNYYYNAQTVNANAAQTVAPPDYGRVGGPALIYSNAGNSYLGRYPAYIVANSPHDQMTQNQAYQGQAYQGQVYTAPTDQAYGDTYGTPGYHAMQAAQAAAQQQVTPPPTGPYNYGQAYDQPGYNYVPYNNSPQVAPVASLPPAANVSLAPGQTLHEVVEGNTVYSLAKSLCVDQTEIQYLNKLDANFSINLGDYIILPASRCF